MLRRSLAGVVPDAGAVLHAAGIDPSARPQELAPGDFLRLAGVAGDR
jgi:16S rRNA A1518/A1519 N6-dimethyltransferase RsmA/KsgA/DIM1 with predicted DNA glycosylase/AP lyase activity